MKFRWSPAAAEPLPAGRLAARLGISPLLAQCLMNRGLTNPGLISAYLEPRLKNLADPFLIPNLGAAVDRLCRARDRGEALVIFGDYDVDGVTSTVFLLESLRKLGWQVDYYLPHRLEEGYGLSRDATENCLRKFPVGLLLAVDCGSTSAPVVDWLRSQGVETIVLDHHQIGDPAPAAVALVNPLCAGPGAAFTELCSVGLAFKLIHALVKRGRNSGWPVAAEFDLRPMLDLVALGTVADLVPLTGENRILVTMGLARLGSSNRPGLLALSQVAQIKPPVGVYEVGFQLAPRLNAAGRLENASAALEVLTADSLATALPIAQSLDARNQERQQIEKGIVEEVTAAVKAKFDPVRDFVIVEGRMEWHVGVVGIVAARVLQQFYRPTLILGGDGDVWRGSGRSIAGFDLAAALRQCKDLLLRHGGHAMAAGLTVPAANLSALRERLNDLAREALDPSALQPRLRLDAEVTLGELTVARLEELERIQPTGQGNPAVQFLVRNVTQARPLQRLGAAKQHLKLWITDGQITHEAVWWRAGNESVLPVGRFDLGFSPQINEFNGRRTVQLMVLDWRPVADPHH